MIMTLRVQWKRSTTPPAVRPGQRDAMIESEGPRWPGGFLVVKTRGKIQFRGLSASAERRNCLIITLAGRRARLPEGELAFPNPHFQSSSREIESFVSP